jgi:integrase
VDTSGPVWLYRPRHHKTAHRGRERVVAIGPRAQAVMAAFPTTQPSDYVFDPRTATTGRRGRPRCVRPGVRYSPGSVSQAVRRAVARANRLRAKTPVTAPIDFWHPNQLRHAHATRVRHEHGLEAAQAVLGHARADVTQVYAERDQTVAIQVASIIG